MTRTWGLAIALLFASACSRHDAAGAAQTTSSDASIAPLAIASGPDHPRGPAICPTTIKGAASTVADTSDGVAITITSKDDAVTEQIRGSTRSFLLTAGGRGGGAGDGTGGGGGANKCPVVARGAAVEMHDVPGGVVVSMKPSDASSLDGMRQQVRDRLAAAP